MKPDYKARKRGEPTMPLDARLYGNIKKNELSGCWEWQGSTNRFGYGRIIIGSRKDGTRRTVSTHRLSYMLNNGAIPDGMEVCHKCDNRRCINPGHLFIGTRQDNVDDREAKGRNKPSAGEKNGRAKLTKADVLEIIEKREQGLSLQRIANEYGVCKATVRDVINGKHWRCARLLPEHPRGGANERP